MGRAFKTLALQAFSPFPLMGKGLGIGAKGAELLLILYEKILE